MFKLEAIEDIKTGQVVASDIFKGGKKVCNQATNDDIGCYIGIATRDIKKGSIVKWDSFNNTEDILIHG